MNYVPLDKRLLNANFKTMSNFDFNKAINGVPIYCNGSLVLPTFIPHLKLFRTYTKENTVMHEWNKAGKYLMCDEFIGNLTTDPPKKKVKKTVKVRLYKNGYGNIMATTIINLQTDNIVKDFETEIEVEE